MGRRGKGYSICGRDHASAFVPVTLIQKVIFRTKPTLNKQKVILSLQKKLKRENLENG